jgi:hypothetical protein
VPSTAHDGARDERPDHVPEVLQVQELALCEIRERRTRLVRTLLHVGRMVRLVPGERQVHELGKQRVGERLAHAQADVALEMRPGPCISHATT